MTNTLLSRDKFREGVFKRDKNQCVVCKEPAVDAHHIIDRKAFDDGGYYLANGVSLCEKDHIKAELSQISCETLRKFAGIKTIILPKGFDPELTYDKWGKEIVEKMKYVKYPRTPHLPWSEKASDDDKRLGNADHFVGREVIVTIKMDGENTTMYDDKTHARSINSDNHISRDWVKGLWSRTGYNIPPNWRICGENLYAQHTIPYSNLTSYFNVFSIWTDEYCLPWDETCEWCELFQLETVPVFYRGIFDKDLIHNSFPKEFNGNQTEGYVIRLADGYYRDAFDVSIGKFVSERFIINTDKHWMQGKVIPNKLKGND